MPIRLDLQRLTAIVRKEMIQRVREGSPYAQVRFNPAQAERFVRRVAARCAEFPDELAALDLPALAQTYTRNLTAWSVRSVSALRRTIETQGFRLTAFRQVSHERAAGATGPAEANAGVRYLIAAEKPR